jgi:hypothetical protein
MVMKADDAYEHGPTLLIECGDLSFTEMGYLNKRILKNLTLI